MEKHGRRLIKSCWLWMTVASTEPCSVFGMDLSHEFEPMIKGAKSENAGSNQASPSNLLFIMTDQMRYDAVGFVQRGRADYNDKVQIRTPNIDALAEKGVNFETAYCVSPSCGPSRASIKTGCTVQRNGVLDNKLFMEKYMDRMDMLRSKINKMISFEQILASNKGYVAETYGKWHAPRRLYYEYNATAFSTLNRIIRYDDYNEYGDPTFLEAMQVKGVYRNALRTMLKRDRVKLKYRKGSQKNTFSGLPYTPIKLDSRFGFPKRTPLSKSAGFKVWQMGDSNVCGVESLPSNYSATAVIGTMALDSLERLSIQAKTQPFALSVHFNAPHPPMVASPDYFSYYKKRHDSLYVSPSITDDVRDSAYENSNKRNLIPKLGNKYPYDDAGKIKELTAAYYAMIEEVDTWVGRLVDVLDRRGLRENTLIVFTSDHGEMMGAHGMMNKAILLEEAARIPLIMSAGMFEKNVTITAPVSQLDLHSTILDYLSAEEFDGSDGTSLRRFIEGTSSNNDFDERVVVVELDERFPVNDHQFSMSIGEIPNYMVRKGEYKLILTKEAASPLVDMLYNLSVDPYETKNLLAGEHGGTASLATIGKAEHLKALLVEWMTRMDGPEQLYSNNSFNLYQGQGDIEEVKARRTWGSVPYWESDSALSFGPLAKSSKGSYVRHEYFYVGKSDPSSETLRVTNIRVTGPDAAHFTLDKTEGEVTEEYLRVRVTLTSAQQNLESLSASLAFQTSSNGARSIPIVLE